MRFVNVAVLSILLTGSLAFSPTFQQGVSKKTTLRPASQFTYSTALGPETGITRRDPSDVIKVGGLYYLWYTKVLESQEGYPSGYPGVIAYATSPDGENWQEEGVCLETGQGKSWDSHGVFTPNILVADGKYYLFYTAVPEPFDVPYTKGITPTAIGVAVADRPEGPWKKFKKNPILKPEASEPDYFDSFRVDDASLIVRDGKYWLYYKGRSQNKSTGDTKMGLAIADKPTGPYKKQKQYGALHAGHEVLVWPLNGGVASMATASGPKAIYFAADGVHFEMQDKAENCPSAPGMYRSDNFQNNTSMQPPYWGISHRLTKKKDNEPFAALFLQKFRYQPE
ncbi:family 43 glycosylhydrolase [Salmonirosea aquatica]|uniref:Family 43 glycosylhydrolase n=1 Tax=Salmonirosea aquatica TaxID=2654236 RepID=A0A7C9FXL4_9BACT|nr:family 43 glycosylhydrolase [Cytophagaceae bacterium SJW1-29]